MKTVKRGLTCIGMIAALLGTPACGRLEQLADPSVTAPAGETMPALDVDQKAAALLPDSVASRSLLWVAIPTQRTSDPVLQIGHPLHDRGQPRYRAADR
jgi:hypothetical protein